MSVIALPAGLPTAEWSIGQARFDMAESSDSTGSQAARIFGPPRWRLAIAGTPAMAGARADAWESLILKLRGRVNLLAAWDMMRPVPTGTLRGTPTLASAAAAGASSLQITGSGTLNAGDWLALGSGWGTSQLVKVVDPAAPVAGVLTVAIEPPLRRAYASGSPVVWDKPIAYYRQTVDPNSWRYVRARKQVRTGFAIDLMEDFGA